MPSETFFNLPDEKRHRILNIAIDEFANNDYRNASISRLVNRAGIAKGSFYQYFADKQDLYLYLLQLAADEKAEFLGQAQPPGESAGFFETVRWLFQHGLDFQFSNPQLAQIGYRAIYGDAPLPDEMLALMRDSMRDFFRPMIARGMAEGDIDPALDPELVIFLITSIMNNLGDYLMGQLDLKPEELLDKGVKSFDRSEYWTVVDGVMGILQKGLAPRENTGDPKNRPAAVSN